jgi:hypothetical protein
MSATTVIWPMRQRRHYLLVSLTAGVCAVAIVGCGSSAHKPSRSLSVDTLLPFSECMLSHGVPEFPDPSARGISIGSTGINPSSPAFEAAQATCNKLLPGGGPLAGASEPQKQQLFAMSKCMPAHGVSGFPDPTTGAAAPSNPQDYSINIAIGSGSDAIQLHVPTNREPLRPAATRKPDSREGPSCSSPHRQRPAIASRNLA